MYNYLVHGIEPGGFFRGWYGNDASSIIRSHLTNTVEALKALTKWMLNCLPKEAWGTHNKVQEWMQMEPAQRRQLLEEHNLIYSEQEEIMMTLRGTYSEKPIFLA